MSNRMAYKGYTANMVFDRVDRIFVGRVLDVDDIVAFHSESAAGFESCFHAVINDYLAASQTLGAAPQQPAPG